jgi:hypothetical protein
MNYRQLLLGLILGLSLFVNSRCQALLIGAECTAVVGAAAYKDGEVRYTGELSLNEAWDATQKALSDLGYAITSEERHVSDTPCLLTAEKAGNKKIRVTLKRQSDALTEIRIRVGTFGDESLSRLIVKQIEIHY